MKIGIIVAMDKELTLLLPLLSEPGKVSVGGRDYHTGRIGRHEVVVCKCGIGKVSAALGTAALADTFHPALIINTGVAGSTGQGHPSLRVLDVMMPENIAYHDVWCGPGTVPGTMQGFPAHFDCPLPDNIRTQLGASGGLLASGDIFVTEKTLRRVLETQPEAQAVDMESAAIAQTCATRAVPFVCLRVISDTPGDGKEYTGFWDKAPAKVFGCVEHLLQIL